MLIQWIADVDPCIDISLLHTYSLHNPSPPYEIRDGSQLEGVSGQPSSIRLRIAHNLTSTLPSLPPPRPPTIHRQPSLPPPPPAASQPPLPAAQPVGPVGWGCDLHVIEASNVNLRVSELSPQRTRAELNTTEHRHPNLRRCHFQHKTMQWLPSRPWPPAPPP